MGGGAFGGHVNRPANYGFSSPNFALADSLSGVFAKGRHAGKGHQLVAFELRDITEVGEDGPGGYLSNPLDRLEKLVLATHLLVIGQDPFNGLVDVFDFLLKERETAVDGSFY